MYRKLPADSSSYQLIPSPTPPLLAFGDHGPACVNRMLIRLKGEHLLYSLLTLEPNGAVGPIHLKAMPVILSTHEEYDIWLNAPTEDAEASETSS
jgi:hypothetical protein